ncbi:MAG TPA: site-specific integrase, partial [Gemmatimonadales bacterium]
DIKLALADRKPMANAVVNLIHNFYNWCSEGEGNLLPEGTPNPARKKKTARYKVVERTETFLEPTDMRTLGEILERARTTGLPPAPQRGLRRERKRGATAKHTPKSVDTLKPANAYQLGVIRLLFLSGLRKNEACSLRWAQVDEARRQATLPNPKGGKKHRQQLGRAAIEFLTTEIERIPGCPFVFPGDPPFRVDANGKKVWRHLVDTRRLWDAIRQAGGFEHVRMHDLRHSFASAVVRNGGDVLMVQALLGHKDIATSMRYIHLIESQVKDMANKTTADMSALLAEGAARAATSPSPLLRAI